MLSSKEAPLTGYSDESLAASSSSTGTSLDVGVPLQQYRQTQAQIRIITTAQIIQNLVLEDFFSFFDIIIIYKTKITVKEYSKKKQNINRRNSDFPKNHLFYASVFL
ncbi:hypothetical protein IJU97_03910 [bacterium]|nr:hypothetical protein [bacterium]